MSFDFKHSARQTAKHLLARTLGFILARPALKRLAMSLLGRLPLLELRLRRLILSGSRSFPAPSQSSSVPAELIQLPVLARRIYIDLKIALERRQKENV